METINEKYFFTLLASENQSEHTDLIINFAEVTNIDLFKITLSNKFTNCKFQGKRLNFFNSSLSADSDLMHFFHFEKCELLNDIYFKDCFIQELKFTQIAGIVKNLQITPNKLGYFTFDCVENLEARIINEINITVQDCKILNYLDFLHLKSTGNLLIRDCEINSLKIHDCSFKRVDIDYSKFFEKFQFTLNSIEDGNFLHNEFNKVEFSNTDFGIDTKFISNDFSGIAMFDRLKNELKTNLKFESCKFMKYTYFNNSKLYHLKIDTSTFHEVASFQELELGSIFLDRTIFEKPAFFDDIEINRFYKCNKRTLRNIKQQLLLSDNKIDYNNFRAHELNAYKEELRTKIKLKPYIKRKKIRRDLCILKINSFYSNNGTDWVKAIKKTLIVALIFYSIFFGIHNSTREIDLFNLSGYSEYFIGLFRFLLITDFHNPLENNREYLLNVFEWIPFILGKIFIGIGIYEILVSFRKFKK